MLLPFPSPIRLRLFLTLHHGHERKKEGSKENAGIEVSPKLACVGASGNTHGALHGQGERDGATTVQCHLLYRAPLIKFKRKDELIICLLHASSIY